MYALLLLLACGDRTEAPPLVADDAFAVELGRRWNLMADGLIAGHPDLSVRVVGEAKGDSVLVWLDGERTDDLAAKGGDFEGSLPIDKLVAGEHQLLLSADDGKTAFAEERFTVSAALYVVASVDWDSPDTDDEELAWHDTLHQTYPSLRLTQLVGPYTFTDPAVSPERRAGFVAWLRANEAAYGDETGLHIHPWCTFIDQTGLTCATETSYVYDGGDETGYTVPLWSYGLNEQVTLLESAIDLFVANGLDAPTSFRAGAWMADENLLAALSNTGFVADSSALNTELIEAEWSTFGDGAGYNNLLWDWNAEQWSTIDATSQPYHPSGQDAAAAGSLAVLELPDNAALADYVSRKDMAKVLEANWSGEALDQPIAYSFGFHNTTKGLGFTYRDDFEGMLDNFEKHLADTDQGPVVYIRMSDAALVWP